jgi:hypothetical protein
MSDEEDHRAGSGIDDGVEAARPEPEPERDGADPQREGRPLIERVGMAGIALVFAALFGVTAAGAWHFGEPFLAAMAGLGCLMTAWVGAITLLRG